MDFIDEKLNDYILAHTDDEPALLNELYRETWIKVLNPRMIAGHLQGRVLSMFSKMIGPEHILEIGTYTGYSAICLAEGLQSGGQVHTIDNNEELEDMAAGFIRRAGFSDLITQHIGNATDIIPSLNFRWDLVYIDADKENYSNYFDLVFDNLRPGGIIIADNVLWNGKVTDPAANDVDTVAIRAFNEKIKNDERVEKVMLPVRDGLTLIRKKT